MKLRSWVVGIIVLGVVAAEGTGRADVSADITKAVTAFVESFATDKPALDGVQVFLPPDLGELPLPSVTDSAKILIQPRLKLLRTVVSKSGTSAWVAGEITSAMPSPTAKTGQTAKTAKATQVLTLRASAVVALDGSTWRVRAADFSVGVPDRIAPPNCGNADNQFDLTPQVAEAQKPVVRVMLDALNDRKLFAQVMSDSPSALVYGSAPKEQFSGGSAIKAALKNWDIGARSSPGDSDALPAIAGGSPDGELVWMVGVIYGPSRFCTTYRGFFVVAKEAAGWRLVHQHYSTPWYPPS